MSDGYRKALKRECDRERSRRMSRQGSFEASMLSLDDPSMRRTDGEDSPAWESDGGKGAESIIDRMSEDAVQGFDPTLKKWMINRLRRHSHLQKSLRRAIKDVMKGRPVRMKETHREKIREILFRQ